MPLITLETIIPGIADSLAFCNWISSSGVTHHEQLSIHQSVLGGTGLFLTMNSLSTNKDIELLRIPASTTYNLASCMSILKDVTRLEDSCAAFAYRESSVIKFFLKNLAPTSELAILQAYFQAFVMLNQLHRWIKTSKTAPKEFVDLLNLSPVRKVDLYTEVLAGVEVPTIDSDKPEVLQLALQVFGNKSVIANITHVLYQSHMHASLIEALAKDETFNGIGVDIFDILPLERFHQINAAVKSRILEIPEEIESKSDDFLTNVTLVPLLDFANHSNGDKLNAYFDIDRVSGDVLLKFDAEKLSDGEVEVCITYTKNEDVAKVFMNYGFVPQLSQAPSVYELYFDEEILLGMNMEYPTGLLKWLKVMPCAQVIETESGTLVDLQGDFFPVLFSGLKYNIDWCVETFGDLEAVQYYESECGDVVPNLVHKAVTRGDTFISSGAELWETLTETERAECESKYSEFLKVYAELRIDQLDIFQRKHRISTLVEHEQRILGTFREGVVFHKGSEALQEMRSKPEVDFEFIRENIEVYEIITGAAMSEVETERQISHDYEVLCEMFGEL
ncbi:hypothetical protein BABINDRAFT_159739 [Babjeviella inositovora NRRL Y-12698]|uniref:SET domain-containing protein n=1 Tax=Babjeviella inositovora NRRL Y-12698 TaxID=984486 RepID=A0A1E3QWJ9_9ASCO|nr:uncharacterized protein BABINDRAFT_159739 [Babjeviella inositovora NRRL Y-12698]ODQ81452.1 hypothetical protein BABINDRAFT_159739 [Babjeviella inositovora NRRL Y-12698]